jgi:hypothetical protein
MKCKTAYFSNTSPYNFDRRTRQTVSSQIYTESLKWSFGADTPLVIDPGRIDDEQESDNLLVAKSNIMEDRMFTMEYKNVEYELEDTCGC